MAEAADRLLDACPVTAERLLTDLRTRNPSEYQRVARPTALREPSCQQGYAVAATVPDGGHDTTKILFGFDTDGRYWHALNVGSADICDGFISDGIADRLTGCR